MNIVRIVLNEREVVRVLRALNKEGALRGALDDLRIGLEGVVAQWERNRARNLVVLNNGGRIERGGVGAVLSRLFGGAFRGHHADH